MLSEAGRTLERLHNCCEVEEKLISILEQTPAREGSANTPRSLVSGGERGPMELAWGCMVFPAAVEPRGTLPVSTRSPPGPSSLPEGLRRVFH